MKRQLRYRDRWVTKVAGKRDLAAVLGTAVAAGLAAHNLKKPDAAYIARMEAVHALQDLDEQGRRVEAWDSSQRDAISERAGRIVEKYIAHDPIPSDWRILAVEETLPSGVARPDLVIDDGRGPTPLDYKVKLSLKREYEEREISRWRMSWQLLHYCRELKADHYYIALIVAEPFRVQLYPFEVHPETMRWWLASGVRYWKRMADDDERQDAGLSSYTEMASRHADEFGECEYAAACFQHRLDPARMTADYVQLPRRVK